MLQPASACPQQDQWLLYTDTDVAINATGFSVGEVMAGKAILRRLAVD